MWRYHRDYVITRLPDDDWGELGWHWDNGFVHTHVEGEKTTPLHSDYLNVTMYSTISSHVDLRLEKCGRKAAFLIHLLGCDRQTVWCAVIGELSCSKYHGGLCWLPLKMLTLGHFPCKTRYLLRMIKASSQSPALSPLYIFYEILSVLELWSLREVFSCLLQVICHVIQESFITALSHFQWLYSESTAEKLNGSEAFLRYTFSQMKNKLHSWASDETFYHQTNVPLDRSVLPSKKKDDYSMFSTFNILWY